MQSSINMHGVPLRKKPRNGQKLVFDAFAVKDRLCAKLPTGYGKTFTATTCFSIAKKRGATRALFIFPTDPQLEQFVLDGPADLYDSGVDGPLPIVDIRFYGGQAVRKSLKNEAQIFAITIQSLINPANMSLVGELMSKGRWMTVVDEYHHYGREKKWGKTVNALMHEYFFAMSATPYRPEDDSAFGPPEVIVSYREAVAERAVKPLRGHCYMYTIDAIDKSGDVKTYTIGDVIKEVGSDQPEDIERFQIEREMRWSPKYVSPLVTIPIDRMLRESIRTGYKLQAIIKCMCVSHAKLVCDQVQGLYPELRVDWVGTGKNGRTVDENRAILKLFCPPKDEHGNRDPKLDVLVNVGMAGEGLDSIFVSEVINCSSAGINNSGNQLRGRAARYLDDVIGHCNFDAATDIAKAGYIGEKIMDCMDDLPPSDDEEEETNDQPIEPGDDWDTLPDDPKIQIWDVRLAKVDSGDLGVQRMAEAAEKAGIKGINYSDLSDPDHPEWDKVIDVYKTMRAREAEQYNEKATIAQWGENVERALSHVAHLVIRRLGGKRMDKGFAGDIRRRINSRKKMELGAIVPNVDTYQRHYAFLTQLEQNIIKHGVPTWLE